MAGPGPARHGGDTRLGVAGAALAAAGMVLIVLAAAGLLRRPGPSTVGHARVTTQRRYGADPFQDAVPVTQHVWPAALPENPPNYLTVQAHVDHVSEMVNRRIWNTDTGGRYSDSQP